MSRLERHLTAQTDEFADFFWHRLRWKAVAEYLPADRPFTVLDVGAGAGHFGAFLEQRVPSTDYRFIEPIASLEQQLEARFGTASNARGRSSFSGVEFVTMLDVLEHQLDDTQFLRGIVAGSDPGTTIIVTVPALMSLWSQWDVDLGHYRRYDRRSMHELLDRVQAEVLEVSYLFPELLLPGLWRARRARAAPQSSPRRSGPESFPVLPRAINRALYALGSPGVTWRRHLPCGTSVVAALRVPA